MERTIIEYQGVSMEKKIEKVLEAKEEGSGVCAIHEFLNHFGDKWSMLIVLHLGHAKKLRFNELKKRIHAISQRMLTVTLRSLESDGLVSRKVYAEIPPRVEYQLTPLGKSLLELMTVFGEWAGQHADEIMEARKQFEKRQKTKG